MADRQIEGEGAVFAHFALDLDLPAQQTGDLSAHRKPEAGPPVLAAGRPIRLLERLGDEEEVVGGPTDIGVRHPERAPRVRPPRRPLVRPGSLRRPPPVPAPPPALRG